LLFRPPERTQSEILKDMRDDFVKLQVSLDQQMEVEYANRKKWEK